MCYQSDHDAVIRPAYRPHPLFTTDVTAHAHSKACTEYVPLEGYGLERLNLGKLFPIPRPGSPPLSQGMRLDFARASTTAPVEITGNFFSLQLL